MRQILFDLLTDLRDLSQEMLDDDKMDALKLEQVNELVTELNEEAKDSDF